MPPDIFIAVVKRAPVSGNMLSGGFVCVVSMTSHCMSPRCLSTDAIMPRKALVSRIRNEFEEMPDTCVTVAEAGRLFGSPLDATARIFSQLIEDGVLRLTPDGRYRRSTTAA